MKKHRFWAMENIIMGLEFDPKEAVLHHEEGMD